jgi:hypothetical protein
MKAASMDHSTTATFVVKAAQAATYGGGGAAVYFGLTANEIAAFGGLAIGLLGLLTNFIYKHLHYRLAERRLEMAGEDE